MGPILLCCEEQGGGIALSIHGPLGCETAVRHFGLRGGGGRAL